jgi:predicted ATPase with chaperone activity
MQGSVFATHTNTQGLNITKKLNLVIVRNLLPRAYHRILKLACTIADLAGSGDIQFAHLAEALQYRPKLMIS